MAIRPDNGEYYEDARERAAAMAEENADERCLDCGRRVYLCTCEPYQYPTTTTEGSDGTAERDRTNGTEQRPEASTAVTPSNSSPNLAGEGAKGKCGSASGSEFSEARA